MTKKEKKDFWKSIEEISDAQRKRPKELRQLANVAKQKFNVENLPKTRITKSVKVPLEKTTKEETVKPNINSTFVVEQDYEREPGCRCMMCTQPVNDTFIVYEKEPGEKHYRDYPDNTSQYMLASRIEECLNAFKGVDNPADYIKTIREKTLQEAINAIETAKIPKHAGRFDQTESFIDGEKASVDHDPELPAPLAIIGRLSLTPYEAEELMEWLSHYLRGVYSDRK